MLRLVATAQGLVYVTTGLWPLVSMGTFLQVTGPKTDLWLVHTVGLLVTVIGAVLLYAAAKREIAGPVVLLAIGSAAMLALIDCFYALGGVISWVYLLDAVGEVLLIALWIAALIRERKPKIGLSGSRSSWTAPSRSAGNTA